MSVAEFGMTLELRDNLYTGLRQMALGVEESKLRLGGILRDHLPGILGSGSIGTVFQPIISLFDGEVIGYEALARGPAHSLLESPMQLFEIARQRGVLWELDTLCRIRALENARRLRLQGLLFLNVDPRIIYDENFQRGFTKEYLREFEIDPARIVFEINEKNSIRDVEGFKKAIAHYKEQGYSIAIDDAGAGYSGLTLITDIHPKFIKLDMSLIRGIDQDDYKHTLVKAFCEFCHLTDTRVVAEGIETVEELSALIDIGVHYGQGYLMQPGFPEPQPIEPWILDFIQKKQGRRGEAGCACALPVGRIARQEAVCSPENTGKQVMELFSLHPRSSGLPVLTGDRVDGMITRSKFFMKLASQYGYSIFAHRPVSLIMDACPLTVDASVCIDQVSRLAMARLDGNLYDDIIVTRDGRYLGIVSVRDLLEKTTEHQVNYARHQNPLTGLPGNLMILQRITECLEERGEGAPDRTVLYADIDNFKVYNDLYGFADGDRMIVFLARSLQECLQDCCAGPSFCGHIGGDDFVAVVDSRDAVRVGETLAAAFEQGRDRFYSEADRRAGCVRSKSRRGEDGVFPLVTLSVAGIRCTPDRFDSAYALSEHAGRVKQRCKQREGSCVLLD